MTNKLENIYYYEKENVYTTNFRGSRDETTDHYMCKHYKWWKIL